MTDSLQTGDDVACHDHQLILELRQRVEKIEQLFQGSEQTNVFSYKKLCAFVLPERRERIMEVCRRLDFYLCEHPSGRWALEFDVDGKNGSTSTHCLFSGKKAPDFHMIINTVLDSRKDKNPHE